ncbi:MAG: hypothetical protein CL674_05780 [Bdellovibrionaceae bacterium]|nr:hypothetical protein [Pseudobdellovibrionaceae bacterium]|tara:strand:- start:7145 stop:9676 length:2532 start_codon:yes stop_codon:yes gene_type:complete
MSKSKFFLKIIGFVVFCSSGWANDELAKLSNVFVSQNFQLAESIIKTRIAQIEAENSEKETMSDSSKKDLAGYFFALGKARYHLKNYSSAEADLLQSLDLSSIFPDYNYHYLGMLAFDQKDYAKAKRYFNKVLNYRPRSHLHLEARHRLADIAMEKKHWNTARKLLRYIERKKRREPAYPFIIEKLSTAEVKRNNFWQACRWMRKLYRSYPTHEITSEWGTDLSQVKIGKFSPKCKETNSDRRSRIKRLLWAGEVEKAHTEIESFRKNTKRDYDADILLVRYFNHKGDVAQSLKVLEKHFESKRYDFEYLNKLASTTAKLGKFPQAVGLYYKAYKLRPRGKKARDSLFQAAYLSYQFQDYDGADRKFEELIKKFPRSGTARDAKWHIAWIRYLKGDYAGANEHLNTMWKQRRRYRWSRAVTNDKIIYWRAMTLLRMDRKEEAKKDLMKLAGKQEYSFYALSARSRVMELFKESVNRIPASMDFTKFEESVANLEIAPSSEDVAKAPEDSEEQAGILSDEEDLEKEEEKLSKLEDEQEKMVESKKTGSAGKGALAMSAPESSDDVEIEEEKLEVTNFRSKVMNQRFERALELMKFGMFDLARWELYDIERRTSNRTYLKTLMEAYHRIGAYHRSGYIGQVYFSSERSKHGIEGAKYLWDFTYPQAYKENVVASANKFGVPPELVWGVMRQESHFRQDIRSPVGARGLMQIMPYTADKLAALLGKGDYRVDQLSTPEINVEFGTRYLQRLNRKFDNKYPLTVAAYNAGPHRVDAWLKNFGHLDMDEFIEHIPFTETRLYVKKVMTNFHVYELLRDQKQFNLDVAMLSRPVGLTYVGDLPTKENWN